MLKNFKSLFFVSDEDAATPAAESQKNQTTETVQTPSVKGQATSGKIDNQILDKLFQALETNNQAGFDYMEFRKALKTLSALSMDESTKYQSTYATAATMGVTLELLLGSIEFYKKVLLNEQEIFTKAIKEQTTAQVGDKIKEKDGISKTIILKSEQIKKLTDEIRAHQADLEKLSVSIETAESKIKETAQNFELSMTVITSQFDQDAIKLKQYIK